MQTSKPPGLGIKSAEATINSECLSTLPLCALFNRPLDSHCRKAVDARMKQNKLLFIGIRHQSFKDVFTEIVCVQIARKNR
ncbi:hypothetical protein DI09_39p110 [Mitosporidium daphniae]|uniref:Uncharacterized protein n=1 Tax=Mitosporidium daphniae TaxID=1485682 RepID=A0A098VQL4_9MICR|nr:uncharacterized protein DI09_39p110 [Mitosporidium daphniae]KGG51317.1 hypothetical protein DI09_39p110 [Mitosporidium daphniae]|eukprot:XP_013237744.1 uncharacterized protein DI09_39p110 [Mitosporidium daphniae]